jgi:TRAP transporter 4TM/12TM fusion protein
MKNFVNVLAVALTCAVVAVSADLFRKIGISLYTEQYLAGLTAIAMPLLFLAVPAHGPRRRTSPPPWYDIVAAILSFAGMAYVTVRFPALSELVSARPWDGLIVAAMMVLLILEGLRRTVGSALLYTTIGFFVLAMFAGYLPGEFAGKSIPFGRLTYYVMWDSTATLGVPLKIVTTIVVVFVFFGHILFRSGGATFFTDVAMALMGRYRGGPAKIAILGSSLFGSISGNVVSNVLTVGVVTIPLMIRVGFRPVLAAAIEANASTGGQMMPPVMGAAAFVMAEFLQVPFSDVALAALIPAVLFYIALFVQVDLEAARRNIRPMERDQIPRLSTVLKQGWYFPIPFVVLIYALFWLHYEPEEAGLLAVVSALILAVVFPYKGHRMNLHDLYEMMRETGLSVLDLFMLGAASGIMIGALNYSGTGFTLSIVLLHLAGGSLIGLLVLSAIANIVLGLGLPTIACYIVLATLVAPTLVKMGIDPMAAHMFILYYGALSMISPPVAIAAFVAANLAGADHNKTGWLAMAFGWTLFVVPFLFVYSPTLLMKGPPYLIAIDFIAAVVGVWLVAAAVMGYSVRPLGVLDRLGYALIGILVFLPADALTGILDVLPFVSADTFHTGRWLNVGGACLAGVLFLYERFVRHDAVAQATPEVAPTAQPATVAVSGDHTEMLEKMGIHGTIEGA